MSTIIESLRAKLAAMGGTLDDGDYDLYLDAPPGYIWRATGSPTLTIHYATNSQSWLAKAVKEETPNMRMGLIRLTDAARLAEIRHEYDEDNWGVALTPDSPDRLEWPS